MHKQGLPTPKAGANRPPHPLEPTDSSRQSGRSSGVEHNLAKVGVEGSNPFARSSFPESENLKPAVVAMVWCERHARKASQLPEKLSDASATRMSSSIAVNKAVTAVKRIVLDGRFAIYSPR
jgi:hypothetical protein